MTGLMSGACAAGRRAIVAWVLLVAALAPGLAQAATSPPLREVALVIGNAAYRNTNGWPRLKNSGNDADLVAAALQGVGFTVVGGHALHDLGHDQIADAKDDFLAKAQTADVVVIYFSGHGVQQDGKNYLIPVDMPAMSTSNLSSLGDRAISLDNLLGELNALGASKIKILMLDACRTSIAVEGAKAGLRLAGGMADVKRPGGVAVWFATSPDMPAYDTPDAANGPYAQSIMAVLRQNGIEMATVASQVNHRVTRLTANKQIPWVSAPATEVQFIFNGPDHRGHFQPFPGDDTILASRDIGGATRGGAGPAQPAGDAGNPKSMSPNDQDDQARPAARDDADNGGANNGDETSDDQDVQANSAHADSAVDSDHPAPPRPGRAAVLQRVFGSGLSFKVDGEPRRFEWGTDVPQVTAMLDHPGLRFVDLPQADEYKGDDVRYAWVPLTNFPELSNAFAHLGGSFHCIASSDSEVVFFFKRDATGEARLFHISLRLYKTDECPNYDWLRPALLGSLGAHLVFQSGSGATDLIYSDIGGASILEITKRGVANEDDSVFKAFNADNN